MNPKIAVLIATKNRAGALKQYALSSLSRSSNRDFAVLVWDASDDSSSEKVCAKTWDFPLTYVKAPRTGLPSQRNDAVNYVLEHWPHVLYVLFIDDDSELSSDALSGLLEGFLSDEVWGINIPNACPMPLPRGNFVSRFFHCKSRRVIEPYLRNCIPYPERGGVDIDWTSGCGMAFRREVFQDYGLRFPEEFQLFGGYALGEDVAFSFYIHKKLHKKLINSPLGHLTHHLHGGVRLDLRRMSAARWYNFHLLFDALYDDLPSGRYLCLKLVFELYLLLVLFKNTICHKSLASLSGRKDAIEALKQGTEIFQGVRI